MMFSPGIIQKLPTCKLVKDSTLRLNRSSRDLQWWDQKTRSKLVISFPQVDGTHPQRSSTYWGIICVIYIYRVVKCEVALWQFNSNIGLVMVIWNMFYVQGYVAWFPMLPITFTFFDGWFNHHFENHKNHVALGVDLSRPSTLPNQIERIWQWSPPGNTGKITVLWSSMVFSSLGMVIPQESRVLDSFI